MYYSWQAKVKAKMWKNSAAKTGHRQLELHHTVNQNFVD